jgi:hypothetical protein
VVIVLLVVAIVDAWLDLIMSEHDRIDKGKKMKRKPKTTTTLKPETTTSIPPVVWKDASHINDNRKRRVDNPVYNNRYIDMTRYGHKNPIQRVGLVQSGPHHPLIDN